MRKYHLALGLISAIGLAATPTSALAKPQTASAAAASRSLPPLQFALRPPALGATARRSLFQVFLARVSVRLAPKSGVLTKKLVLPASRFGLIALDAKAPPRRGSLLPRPLVLRDENLSSAAASGVEAPGSVRAQNVEAGVGAARTKIGRTKPEPPPCFKGPIVLTRQLGDEIEQSELSLAYCDGKINPTALDALSILARSRSVARPGPADTKAYQRLPVDEGPEQRRRDPAYVAPLVMRLHPGLLERLQKVVERFPKRPLEIVSGHRPEARNTSRHHHGRALDFRVQGVARERLRDFLRTLEETGVGYYPNSSFVHMDVRDDKGYWVDRSGPGERADYGVWPPPKREIEQSQARILQGALADLAALDANALATASAPRRAASQFAAAPRVRAPRASAHGIEPREEGDTMSAREVEKIRQEALKALADLR